VEISHLLFTFVAQQSLGRAAIASPYQGEDPAPQYPHRGDAWGLPRDHHGIRGL